MHLDLLPFTITSRSCAAPQCPKPVSHSIICFISNQQLAAQLSAAVLPPWTPSDGLTPSTFASNPCSPLTCSQSMFLCAPHRRRMPGSRGRQSDRQHGQQSSFTPPDVDRQLLGRKAGLCVPTETLYTPDWERYWPEHPKYNPFRDDRAALRDPVQVRRCSGWVAMQLVRGSV